MRRPRMRRSLGAAALAALALLAAGCSGSKDKIACPEVVIAPDLSAVVKFRDGPGREMKDIAYAAKMIAVSPSCGKGDEKDTVDVATKLGITALRRGDDIRKGQVVYFVAITDPSQTILAKRDFVVDLDFPSRQSQLDITEDLTQHIPFPKGAITSRYAVIFGFQLNPEELAYNRDHLAAEDQAKPAPPPAGAPLAAPAAAPPS